MVQAPLNRNQSPYDCSKQNQVGCIAKKNTYLVLLYYWYILVNNKYPIIVSQFSSLGMI